jgi:DNA polymerase III subunit gamma/tau
MSKEKTLYRKYRPLKFKDVLGQNHITSVLESSIKGDNFSHAYLFSGPRGTGKTSIARILASELGTSANDLIEIDGASNRGIDDIRELKEAVFINPFDSKFKIYIIDEVHMLSRDAFNALLKTLEEPPKHVIFVLATTELHKVPDTIISRCQGFELKKPSDDILKKSISSIAKSEGFSLSAEGANLISIMAEGSFRDAQGILQKVLSISSGKEITLADIENITGAPNRSLVNNFIEALLDGDAEKGFEQIEKAKDRNIDMTIFLKMILRTLRFSMLIKFAPDMKKKISEDVGEGEYKEIEAFSRCEGSKNFVDIMKRLIDAYEDMRSANIKELPLELALVEIIGKEE